MFELVLIIPLIILQCLEDIYESHILEPICESSENTSSSRLLLTQLSEPWCRVIIFLYLVYLRMAVTFDQCYEI